MDAPANSKSSGKFGDLKLRIITGVAFASIAGTALWLGGWFWYGFVLLCAAQMLREWYHLTTMRSLGFRLLGIPYILLPSAVFLSVVTIFGSKGTGALLLLILVVAATDIGAYFAGRLIGGKKLAPRLSPNKTWAGLGGGVLAAIGVFLVWTEGEGFPDALWWGAILAITAQCGDIFESSLKRRAGVKDAGNILPGHGGLLDRLDGLLFAAPVFVLLAVVSLMINGI